MSSARLHPQSNAVSIFEMAYHDAWKRYLTMYQKMLDTINKPGFSLADHESVIGDLGLIKLQIHTIHERGMDMWEKHPQCQTVRHECIGYFSTTFSGQCHNLLMTLDSLVKLLMTDKSVKNIQEVHSALRLIQL